MAKGAIQARKKRARKASKEKKALNPFSPFYKKRGYKKKKNEL